MVAEGRKSGFARQIGVSGGDGFAMEIIHSGNVSWMGENGKEKCKSEHDNGKWMRKVGNGAFRK